MAGPVLADPSRRRRGTGLDPGPGVSSKQCAGPGPRIVGGLIVQDDDLVDVLREHGGGPEGGRPGRVAATLAGRERARTGKRHVLKTRTMSLTARKAVTARRNPF